MLIFEVAIAKNTTQDTEVLSNKSDVVITEVMP